MSTSAPTLVDTVLHKSDFDCKIDDSPTAYTVPAPLYIDDSAPVTPAEEYELPTLPATRVASLAPSTQPINPPSSMELKRARRREYTCYSALLWSIWLEGWNDGSNGPLIPTMQKHYHVSRMCLQTQALAVDHVNPRYRWGSLSFLSYSS